MGEMNFGGLGEVFFSERGFYDVVDMHIFLQHFKYPDLEHENPSKIHFQEARYVFSRHTTFSGNSLCFCLEVIFFTFLSQVRGFLMQFIIYSVLMMH